MKEYRSFQSPIEMTQLEVEGMKAGDKKVLQAVSKRIKNTAYRDELDKSSIPDEQQNKKDTPVDLSKEDLAILKMGGKIPEKLSKKISGRSSTIQESITDAVNQNSLKSAPHLTPPKR